MIAGTHIINFDEGGVLCQCIISSGAYSVGRKAD